jgi:FAD/FMN-containing dehydrogenase
MNPTESWGRYPKVEQESRAIRWRHEQLPIADGDASVLPYGQGRSYGDSCLNADGVLLTTAELSRFIQFDKETGILRCEAGVTLEHVINHVMPYGWFLPVSPGTKFVSVAGALANDIHGKNHHQAGNFGHHVRAFELLRSDGERLVCTPEQNQDYFIATIGGLGLTGFITWVEFQLIPVNNVYIDNENIRLTCLDDFFDLTEESVDHPYTVSWIDSTATGDDLGRGIFMRGSHAPHIEGVEAYVPPKQKARVPFDFPGWTLNAWTVRAFNTLYYAKQWQARSTQRVHYEPFFYPLDMVKDWNRIYGQRGFLQYQSVMPYDGDRGPTRALLERIASSGLGSFLTVLKMFGQIESLGLMSFPRPGITLALDFPFTGDDTLRLLNDLDAIVKEAGGALYPAKDARMSSQMFQLSYPKWEEFEKFIDPQFSSSFWRRVTPS